MHRAILRQINRPATLSTLTIRARTTTRLFTDRSSPLQKSATQSAKDGLKAVDRAVSDQLVKGIDKTVEATGQVAAKIPTKGEAADEAQRVQGQMKGKAEELKGRAAGEAERVAGKAKGKVSEVEGEIKKRT